MPWSLSSLVSGVTNAIHNTAEAAVSDAAKAYSVITHPANIENATIQNLSNLASSAETSLSAYATQAKNDILSSLAQSKPTTSNIVSAKLIASLPIKSPPPISISRIGGSSFGSPVFQGLSPLNLPSSDGTSAQSNIGSSVTGAVNNPQGSSSQSLVGLLTDAGASAAGAFAGAAVGTNAGAIASDIGTGVNDVVSLLSGKKSTKHKKHRHSKHHVKHKRYKHHVHRHRRTTG